MRPPQRDTGSFFKNCRILEFGEAGVVVHGWCVAGILYCSSIEKHVCGHSIESAETGSSYKYTRDSNNCAPGSTVQYDKNREKCGLHMQKQPGKRT